MALHSRYAVTVSAAVATRSRADCSSMEDRRRKSLINVLYEAARNHHRHHERGNERPYQPNHSPSSSACPPVHNTDGGLTASRLVVLFKAKP